MVDKVNLNPFTNSAFTVEQIEELDTNGDGFVSNSEMYAKWSWLSENSKDVEGSLDNSTGYSGAQGQANTTDELKSCINTILDEYIESYYNANPTLSDIERSSVRNILTLSVNEFTNNCILTNPNGPWDLQAVSQLFIQQMDNAIKSTKEAYSKVTASIDSYAENAESNLTLLLAESFTADENNYVTEEEWNKVKNKAVQYLMGTMLSDKINIDVFTSLNPKFQHDANYRAACEAISQLKTETDPAKMQQLLTLAQEKINAFVQSCGKDNAVDALNDYAKAKGEAEVKSKLDAHIEAYLEQMMTAEMTDEQRAQLKTFVQNCADKYMAKLVESETIDEVSEQDLVTGFNDYVLQQNQLLANTQLELYKQSTEIDASFEKLKEVSDEANANGNITPDERAAIIEASKTLIKTQLLAGNTQIAMLDKLGINSSEMISLVSKMWTENDPDKLIEMKTQLEELIAKALEKCSGEDLVNAVNSMKPVEITDSIKGKAIDNSSISSAYVANASRSTSRGKQTEERLQEIQEMAKADLNAFAESLKVQLQAELGAAYNEADVQRYINDAINDTISLFTQNVYRKNQHGNYTTSSDNQAFVFARRSGTRKGRYVYNVQSLINTFVDKFNETSKIKNASKLDPSKATYDKENVIADSLGNDYDRNNSIKITGNKNDNANLEKLIDQAKENLKKVAASVKASLIAEGVPIDMSTVDSWLDDCIADTIKDMRNAFQRCKANGKVSGGGIGSLAGGVGAGVATATGLTAAAGTALGLGATTTINTLTGVEASSLFASMFPEYCTSVFALSGAVPIVGWALAGVGVTLGVLGFTTNIFGAHYGKHNSDAGFYVEEKSHSSKGRWGYDTQTLVNVFLAKVDAKIAEEKEKERQKHNPEVVAK